jgi:hypothetical protein
MTVAKLDKADWQGFFDRASRVLLGKHTKIEILDPTLGNQVEVRWLPLLGMTYDANSDTIEITFDGLDHIVSHPILLYVDHAPGLVVSLQIIGSNGVQQIIVLRDAPMLPAPFSS